MAHDAARGRCELGVVHSLGAGVFACVYVCSHVWGDGLVNGLVNLTRLGRWPSEMGSDMFGEMAC